MSSKLPARLPPLRPRLCDVAPSWFANRRERWRREPERGREGHLRNAKLAPKAERRWVSNGSSCMVCGFHISPTKPHHSEGARFLPPNGSSRMLDWGLSRIFDVRTREETHTRTHAQCSLLQVLINIQT
jgi:hypothetical protein